MLQSLGRAHDPVEVAAHGHVVDPRHLHRVLDLLDDPREGRPREPPRLRPEDELPRPVGAAGVVGVASPRFLHLRHHLGLQALERPGEPWIDEEAVEGDPDDAALPGEHTQHLSRRSGFEGAV